MTSPVLELQGAIVARLKAQGVADGRVYDLVPPGATFPYVELGPFFEDEADAECIPGSEISIRLEVWSRTPGRTESLRIAQAIKSSLHDAVMTLDDNALVSLRFIRIDGSRDPDGLTSHATVEVRAIVEQPLI